eukprot:TRINITY_DN77597_c0_g1_i1.p3 TRINITY_DN77597_c0_g1~~TRINITY_DN77597_c0_g1_i1.p3  ORF type:complete len:131 (+),score=13.64 TRINITY_DN77597_c0_g1_i1:296-688(+)
MLATGSTRGVVVDVAPRSLGTQSAHDQYVTRLDSLARCNELDQHFLHDRPRDVYSHDIAYCSPLNPFDPESHTRIRTTREGYHGYGWYGKEVSCGDQHDVEDDEDGDRVSFSTDDNDDDDSQDAANHNDG